MSLYHYVRNKDEILDGIVDAVFNEIELPVPGGEWKAELKRRATFRPQCAAPASVGDCPDGIPDHAGAGEPPPP